MRESRVHECRTLVDVSGLSSARGAPVHEYASNPWVGVGRNANRFFPVCNPKTTEPWKAIEIAAES